MVKFSRYWDMPSADTFDMPSVSSFVKKYAMGSHVSIDPFARNKRIATYTNDLNPGTQAEYHMDALEFLLVIEKQNVQADLVLFDPPYSLEQCKRSYESVGRVVTMRDTQIWGRWTEHKDILSRLLKVGGVCLSFGWNSIGLGKKRGCELEEIMMVCHGATHNDTICIAERKIQGTLL